ncbi:hypothetical protein ACILDS_00590 [Capnocytophaga canis]
MTHEFKIISIAVRTTNANGQAVANSVTIFSKRNSTSPPLHAI